MQENAYLKCIDIHCGLEYPISSINVECDKGHLLDVKYKQKPSESLKEIFLKRRNPEGSIFNESGVWRFRELLNFCQINTENVDDCASSLVSLDGAEGRQSKPYQIISRSPGLSSSSKSVWYDSEICLMILVRFSSKVTISSN